MAERCAGSVARSQPFCLLLLCCSPAPFPCVPCMVGTGWLTPSTEDPQGYFSIKVLLWVPGYCCTEEPDCCAVLFNIY